MVKCVCVWNDSYFVQSMCYQEFTMSVNKDEVKSSAEHVHGMNERVSCTQASNSSMVPKEDVKELPVQLSASTPNTPSTPSTPSTTCRMDQQGNLLASHTSLTRSRMNALVAHLASAYKSSDNDDIKSFIEHDCADLCSNMNDSLEQLFDVVSQYVHDANICYKHLQVAVTQSEEEAKESFEDLLSYIRAFSGESEEAKCRQRLASDMASISNASATSVFQKLRPFLQRTNLHVKHMALQSNATQRSTESKKRGWESLQQSTKKVAKHTSNPHKPIPIPHPEHGNLHVHKPENDLIRSSLLNNEAQKKTSFFDDCTTNPIDIKTQDPVMKETTDYLSSMRQNATNGSVCKIQQFAAGIGVDRTHPLPAVSAMAKLIASQSDNVQPLMHTSSNLH